MLQHSWILQPSNWFNDWPTSQLNGRLDCRFNGWLHGAPNSWPEGWLGSRLSGWPRGWLSASLSGSFKGWLSGWPNGCLSDWLNNYLSSWFNGRLTGWLSDWLRSGFNGGLNGPAIAKLQSHVKQCVLRRGRARHQLKQFVFKRF